ACIETLQARGILRQDSSAHHRTGIVGFVASACIAPARQFAGHKTAGVDLVRGDASGCPIYGARQSADPTIEVIPPQLAWGSVAGLVMLRSGKVKLPEHCAFVICLF